jgi:hypothetical protein
MAGSGDPLSSFLFDFLRSQALAFDELRRIQHLLTERVILPAVQGGEPAMEGSGEEGLAQVLRRFQVLLLEHPLAAQAAFSALMSEGRRFAATPEGAAWKSTLAGSDLVRNGRKLWETLSLGILEDDASTVVPSVYLEALFQAATSPELEALLRGLRSTAAGNPHGAP